MTIADRANELQQKIASSGEVTPSDEAEAESIYSEMIDSRGGANNGGCKLVAFIIMFISLAPISAYMFLA